MDARFDPDQSEAEGRYLETISLLQDEVARLEGELLAQQSLAASPAEAPAEDPGPRPADAAERERLSRELAERDETIGLLLDQLRLVEEAERATRAEWEQLASWLAEVEDRVDRREQEAPGEAAGRLAELERQAEEARAAHARERGTWERERRDLGRENERLGALLAERIAAGEAAGARTSGPDPRLADLESKVGGLRRRCRELEAERDEQSRSLNEALEDARRRLEEAGRQAAAVEDERARERREFEIAISSIRAQAVRATLHATADGPGDEPAAKAEPNGALEADIRIRVFRQHLREIHEQEAETRKENRLGARLSRLWSRTAPAPAAEPAGRK